MFDSLMLPPYSGNIVDLTNGQVGAVAFGFFKAEKAMRGQTSAMEYAQAKVELIHAVEQLRAIEMLRVIKG